MKRKISILACLLMLAAIIFALASCNSKPEDPHVHEYTAVEVIDSTCTQRGQITYACRCGKGYTEETPVKEHTKVTIPGIEPDCTNAGLTEGVKCSDCGTILKQQSVINCLGHKVGAAPTCTTAQTCIRCDHVFKEALGHTEVIDESIAATCTSTGLTDGKHCSICSEVIVAQIVTDMEPHSYDESVGGVFDTDCNACGATRTCGHESTEVIEGYAATCTSPGLTDGKKCTICSEILESREVIDELGHDYEAVVTAPTCTTAGYTTHTCKNDSTHTYTDDHKDALGHTWNSYSLTLAPTYEATGLISGTCANCDGVPTKEIPAVSEENGYTALITGVLTRWQYTYNDFTFTVDLTNTDAVTNTYSATNGTPWYVGFNASDAMVKLDGYKTTDAAWDGTNLSFGGTGMTYYTTVTAPKDTTVTLIINCARNKAKPFFTAGTEHCIDNLTVNGSTDGVICFANAQLSVTGWHTYTDYAIATLFLKEGDNVISFKSATTVNFKGISYVSTEALHIHTDVVDAVVDPTCTATGLAQGLHCSECNKVLVEQTVIEALGHTEVIDAAVAADCTNTGLTEGKHCVTCGEVLVAQTVIDALGHSYDDDTDESCNRCGFVRTIGCAHETIVAISEAKAATCTEQGNTAGEKCADCGEVLVAQNVIEALGHTWNSYALTLAPTYEATGLISGTCANCDGVPTKEIPAVSEENGYTALITGVLTRWQYTYNDFTFTVDLTNTDAVTNTYSATNGTPWYVGFNASDAMVKLDGYKTTDAAWDGTNHSFGGSGKTYYTTVTAPKATTVTLIINCARNKAKPFFTAGTEHCIDNLTVNGSTDGVICFANAQLSVTGWHTYTDYAIATLFLKEGDNVISFKSATTVNFKGISYVSTEELHIHTDAIDNVVAPTCLASGLTQGIHCSECNKVLVAKETIIANGVHTFETYSMITVPDYTSEGQLVKKCTLCGVADEESVVVLNKVSEENGYVKVSSTDTEDKWQYTYAEQTFDIVIATTFDFVAFVNDPFIAENGGSISGTISVTNDTPRYQNTQGQTFTATITVSSDTVADFIIKVENGNKTNTYAGLFSSITLDGATVTINDGSVTGKGWGNSIDIVVASLNLTKGTHVITFTRNTDGASNNNFNIWGIGFITSDSVSITLGSAE